MDKQSIKTQINHNLNKHGGIFVLNLYLATNCLYSEDFLRKWARANNVEKLSNSYFFKKQDIDKLTQDTENFTKPQSKIKIVKKRELKYIKTTINPYIPAATDGSNLSKDQLRKKDILSSLDVAYITNYSVQTINKWAKYYGLPKDSVGYSWTQSDLKRFEIRKFIDKDSYHVHINKTLYGKRNMSLRGWVSLIELTILIFIILIFCCSI